MRTKSLFTALLILLLAAVGHAFHSLQVIDHAQQVEQNCRALGGRPHLAFYTGRAYWLHADVNCVVTPDHQLAVTTFVL